jgi:hypothetical protein
VHVNSTEDLRMKKTMVAIAAAALLASAGTFAFAQGTGAGGPGAPAAGEQRGERPGLSQDDFNRFVDARVAAIKAGLKLSADQERLWQPVEDAIRRNAGERFTRYEQRGARREQRQATDFMQQLEARGTMMTENAQRASALATAMRPLWNSFSEDQKRIAPRLMRSAMNGMGWRERGDRRGRGEHGRRGAMMQHGHGGMGPGGMGGGQQAPAQPQQ